MIKDCKMNLHEKYAESLAIAYHHILNSMLENCRFYDDFSEEDAVHMEMEMYNSISLVASQLKKDINRLLYEDLEKIPHSRRHDILGIVFKADMIHHWRN